MASAGSHLNWPPVEGIISDLDGEVYRGNAAIPDAIAAFGRWQAAGVPVCFVPNNSTHTPEDVVRKLEAFGLAIAPKDVVTSAITAAELIRAKYPDVTRICYRCAIPCEGHRRRGSRDYRPKARGRTDGARSADHA
ncbi:hypothetical protein [Bradyrhizobium sp. RT5a]|uniref:hypothetical protein n=1 Tax=unclassified Bradyrhizobium TaxID=2631580 RepID=UPI003397484D